MDCIDVTVDLDALRELDTLVHEIKRETNAIRHGKSFEPKQVGARIWERADKIDAILRNWVLPFGTGSANSSLQEEEP